MNNQFDIQLLRDAIYQSAEKIKDLRDTVKINSKDSIGFPCMCDSKHSCKGIK